MPSPAARVQRPGRRAAAAALVLGAAVAAAPAAAEPDPERGRALAERWCVSCHVIGPDGPGADAGPAFPTLGDRSETQLRGWLAEPHPPMPDLQLSGPDIDDLAAYIRSVAAPKSE